MGFDDTDITEAEAERGRALVSAASAQVSAPLALRARLEAAADTARTPRRGWRPTRVGRPQIFLGGGLAAALAAVVLVVVLAGGSGTTGPSALQVADVAGLVPTGPPPEEQHSNPTLLNVSVDGVSFPYWDTKFDWSTAGTRRDTVHGRRVLTVFYRNVQGARLGYAIVSGHVLGSPEGRDVVMNGVRLRVTHHGSRLVVVWTRSGHSCVISAPTAVPERNVLALASWRAKGSVRF